jgi:hypothetical protein
MSDMEPSTSGRPPVSEPPRPEAAETFFKTPNAPAGRHFEQLTVPGLFGSGPLVPEVVSKFFRKLFRRKRSAATR